MLILIARTINITISSWIIEFTIIQENKMIEKTSIIKIHLLSISTLLYLLFGWLFARVSHCLFVSHVHSSYGCFWNYLVLFSFLFWHMHIWSSLNRLFCLFFFLSFNSSLSLFFFCFFAILPMDKQLQCVAQINAVYNPIQLVLWSLFQLPMETAKEWYTSAILMPQL